MAFGTLFVPIHHVSTGDNNPADPSKQDDVVYKTRCECGKVYIGETRRPMQEIIKEHERHPPRSNSELCRLRTRRSEEKLSLLIVITMYHWYMRKVKEPIHTRPHPNKINRNDEIEIPEMWVPTIKKHTGSQRTPGDHSFFKE